MMGEDVLSIRTTQYCFNRFKNGNLELDNSPRPGRPREVDVDHLKLLIEQDPRLTSWCLAEQLGCSHTAVEKLKRIRQNMEIWSVGYPISYHHISFNTRLMLVWI